MGLLRNPTLVTDTPPTNSGGSDAMLVAQAKIGDAQAFSLLFRRYLDQVYDYTRFRLESREAAEDATQTIFLRAFASIGQCQDGARFAGWLFAIARNVLTDAYRARRPIDHLDDTFDLADPDESPESRAIRSEDDRMLREIMTRCVSGSEQEHLLLRLQNLSDREIAVAMGRSPGAIRVAQHRMLKKLRKCLDRALPNEVKGAADA